jgi:Fur family zinc uptake transcriptional regulator
MATDASCGLCQAWPSFPALTQRVQSVHFLGVWVADSAHDHQGCIDTAIALAERLCAERGVRFTPLRRRVLELIWSNHESVKAYDLLDELKPFDKSAKPATVYRTLDFLLEQGLIHRIESLNAFVGCRHPERQHELLLLICERCHQVDERPALELVAAAAREIEATRFTAHRQSFEIRGLCASCVESGAAEC